MVDTENPYELRNQMIKIFTILIMVVLVIISSIHAILFFTDNLDWNPGNWITLIVEIGVGIGLAAIFATYSNIQQKNSNHNKIRFQS